MMITNKKTEKLVKTNLTNENISVYYSDIHLSRER